MAIIQLTPKINHLNFIHSYLIKTKDVSTSNIQINLEDDKTIMKVGLINYNLVDFPKDHIPYYNTVKEDGNLIINILAIPENLKSWNEK